MNVSVLSIPSEIPTSKVVLRSLDVSQTMIVQVTGSVTPADNVSVSIAVIHEALQLIAIPHTAPCHVCGPSAECTARDHEAICVCPPGQVGEPYNKQVGCFTPPPIENPPEVRTIPPVQDLQVMCLADGVQVAVQLGGYDGIVYVKGHSNDAKCRRLVTSNDIDSIDFKVLFGECGLIHVDVSFSLGKVNGHTINELF